MTGGNCGERRSECRELISTWAGGGGTRAAHWRKGIKATLRTCKLEMPACKRETGKWLAGEDSTVKGALLRRALQERSKPAASAQSGTPSFGGGVGGEERRALQRECLLEGSMLVSWGWQEPHISVWDLFCFLPSFHAYWQDNSTLFLTARAHNLSVHFPMGAPEST